MINTKLQSIIDTKSAIGNAIVNKGGTITSETPFFNYASEIDNISTGSVLTGNATADQVFNGQTFYSNDANTQLTGTFTFTGNATTGDVSTGKTFYATNGTKLTGTGSLAQIAGTDQTRMSFYAAGNAISDGWAIRSLNVGGGNVFVSGIIDAFENTILYKYSGNGLNLLANTAKITSWARDTLTNNGFVYLFFAGIGPANTIIRKYHQSNLASVATSAEIPNIAVVKAYIKDNFIYYVGAGSVQQIKKIHEGNLVQAASVNIADGLTGQAVYANNSFVFTLFSNGYLGKYHTSNLVLSASANLQIGGSLMLTGNNGFLFASGSSRYVNKLREDNLALNTNIAVPLFAAPISVALNNGYLYFGTSAGTIQKHYESNLVLLNSYFAHTSNINSVAINNGYIFSGDAFIGNIRVRQHTDGLDYITFNGGNYYFSK